MPRYFKQIEIDFETKMKLRKYNKFEVGELQKLVKLFAKWKTRWTPGTIGKIEALLYKDLATEVVLKS